MVDYSAINIDKLIIHKVGNKQKKIENQVSNKLCYVDDDLSSNLINYFFTPFSKQIEVNKLHHHSDLELNDLYNYSQKLFNKQSNFQEISNNILTHLYEQSEHPHIKIGELMIAHFSDIIFDDILTDAIGIFKIERRQNYFKFSEDGKSLSININEGISSKRIDKGCLIVNIEPKDGYRVLSVDNNNYDTEYWKNKFLSVQFVKDFYYHTSNYVDFCKSFSEDVLENNKGKDEQIAFLNKSINYLSDNEQFDINEFATEIFEEPNMRKEFFDYKNKFEQEKETEVQDSFQISQNSVKSKKRSIKSLIKLDTNIQIKLDNNDPESNQQFIEKGFDKVRGMKYYKVFYNTEAN
jgi:37-kD nucleoid-associated bacterial protein